MWILRECAVREMSARITREVRRKQADENQNQRQRVVGTGQVLGTASLFRVRVREQPPSITGGSWHLERYIDSPHPRIESNAAGKNTNEQNRTLWSMLRSLKFIDEWVTAAGAACILQQHFRRFRRSIFPSGYKSTNDSADVTVNSCLRLRIRILGESGRNARTTRRYRIEIFWTFVSQLLHCWSFLDTSIVAWHTRGKATSSAGTFLTRHDSKTQTNQGCPDFQ